VGTTELKILGPIHEALSFAREMHILTDELLGLKPSKTGAEWFVYHREMSKAVKISVPHFALKNLPWLGLPLQPKMEDPSPPPQEPDDPSPKRKRQRFTPP
jgi:hypothetical protein